MPNITAYYAPNLDLNPSERGASAWESSARRFGAYYGDAAQSRRQQGSLAAQAEKQKMWPFDILLLDARRVAAEAASGSGGINLRVKGGVGDGFGGSSTQFADFGESRNTGAPAYAGFGQVSRGASALGQMLSDGGYTVGSMVGSNSGGGGGKGGGKGGGEQSSNWSLWNEALAYANKITSMFPEGPDMVSFRGEWIKASDERKINAQEQDQLEQYRNREYSRKIDVQDYWRGYYGTDAPPVYGPQQSAPAQYQERGVLGGLRDWISDPGIGGGEQGVTSGSQVW